MHYVMSDIHGQYEAYERMKEKIRFAPDDKLYIIGDVIDRGPDSMLVLLDVMTDDRITLLIGNHEDMMLRSKLDADMKHGWYRNGAGATERSIEKEKLTELDVKQIEEYLLACPLVIPDLNVNGNKYYLAHAAPLIGKDSEYLYADAAAEEIHCATWSRSFAKIDSRIFRTDIIPFFYKHKGVKLIIGHTPSYKTTYSRKDEKEMPLVSDFANRIFDIDCGGAKGIRLACLRLEDQKKYYIDI